MRQAKDPNPTPLRTFAPPCSPRAATPTACRPHARTQDDWDNVVSDESTMEEKSKEFMEKGGEIYLSETGETREAID